MDDPRINRYDIAVPAFGLAALWVTIHTVARSRSALHALSGSLAGLSGLSHLDGAFWLPTLVALLFIRDGLRRSTLRSAALLVTGFAVIWLPWLSWIGLNAIRRAQDVRCWSTTVGTVFPWMIQTR